MIENGMRRTKIVCTIGPASKRRLALSWGVSSRLIHKVATTDEMIEEIEATLLKLHRVGERR